MPTNHSHLQIKHSGTLFMMKIISRRGLIVSLALAAVLLRGYAVELSPEDKTWPEFRGPTGQGHARATNIPSTWSETQNIAWKTPLPGKGWSSPVTAGKLLWMTCAEVQPASEELKQKRLKVNTGDQPLDIAGHVDFFALGVDPQTGELVKQVKLLEVDEPQQIHTLNSFASPTPVIEGDRLYCHFGAFGNACLDTSTGNVIWTNQKLVIMHENGPGSTPILHDDKLIFHCDGSDYQYIVALDKATGELAWRTDRTGELNSNKQLKKAYGTPLIVKQNWQGTEREVLLSPAADWLYAYDPANGQELWKLNYGALGFSIVPRPVTGHGKMFMCTSFMKSELLAVQLDGQGKIPEPHIAWRYGKQVPSMSSPLLVGNELFLVHDNGVATCLDARQGTVHWTERLGGKFCASPLFVDGKVLFCNTDGVTTVINPGVKFEKLADNQLDGAIMASPIALEQALYIRTDKAIYKIQGKE
ncbi:MAG: PQQ-binding-like beta-propeller repeat protein [Pirellulales bacterium]|nr:PQQ-binding-like beta-propeller repeat protein [Pirellulales bacterium]